uniref:Uncharacterized protein n=1 Tax=Rhizophora mucronata TaxID=61149 RepID=A0A2P2PNH6_RHIMU
MHMAFAINVYNSKNPSPNPMWINNLMGPNQQGIKDVPGSIQENIRTLILIYHHPIRKIFFDR